MKTRKANTSLFVPSMIKGKIMELIESGEYPSISSFLIEAAKSKLNEDSPTKAQDRAQEKKSDY